ncbi:MAG TPA: heme o synthase [Candidatus Limnocylindrales bacterium]|jgi:protoheme IX farnesyltransferase
MTRFQRLTLITALVTFAVVVMGAVTRSTDSGMGCGTDWPLCHGLLPALSDTQAWIEWWHRAFALALGVLVVALLIVAVLRYRAYRSVVVLAAAAFVIALIQAWLGQITVASGNSSSSVTAHLATAMLLFGVLITIAIRVQYPAGLGSGLASQRFTVLAAFTAACVYALLLFGAEVRGNGAALVFSDWPLFNGQLVPTLSPDATIAQMQVLQFLHRLVALVAGLVVLSTAWVAWRRYDRHAWGPAAARPTLLLLVGSAAALFLIQSIVGAAQIFTDLAAWAEALHVGLGAAIWGLLVAATVYAWCEARRPAGAPADGTPRGLPDDRRDEATARLAQPGGLAMAVADQHPPVRGEIVRAYIALTKPRIIELLLVTTVPAMILAAHGMPPLALIVATLVGGSLAAGSANAINQYLDRDIDALMTRTRRRPLPAHAVTPENALVFGFALGVVAFAELTLLVNLLAAFLALLAIGFYVVVYTMLLKRTTPQNIVIGGAAGALPPVIGVAAVTGDITLPALVLFAIVFYWTPPHFWALALRLAKDYRAAGVPMLPVVRGVPETTRQILRYTLVLVALTLVFFVVGHMGAIYLVSAVGLGGIFIWRAVRLRRQALSPEASLAQAIRLYRYSIAYLSLLFVAVAVDTLVVIRIPIG